MAPKMRLPQSNDGHLEKPVVVARQTISGAIVAEGRPSRGLPFFLDRTDDEHTIKSNSLEFTSLLISSNWQLRDANVRRQASPGSPLQLY
jgi:hypothetical protein